MLDRHRARSLGLCDSWAACITAATTDGRVDSFVGMSFCAEVVGSVWKGKVWRESSVLFGHLCVDCRLNVHCAVMFEGILSKGSSENEVDTFVM